LGILRKAPLTSGGKSRKRKLMHIAIQVKEKA
jgi:hypothetical protein